MVKQADVVLENYRPGTMEKFGLGYEELKKINPKIVYAACSGFGHSGPYMLKPAYDIIVQAMGGIMSITGPEGGEPTPGDQLLSVQNYFAEYHLEYFRQRRYNHFPSRLHALLLFATKVDAENFRTKHPSRVFGKYLVRARSKGTYTVSFHDSSWLD